MNRILIVLCALFILSCNSVETDTNSSSEAPIIKDTIHSFDKKQMLSYIRESEDRLLKDAGKRPVDLMAAQSLISQYETFIKQFPTDSVTPSYLFKQGELCIAVKNGKKAADCFIRIINDFKSSSKLPHALYMCGFVHDDMLNEDDAARLYYERLIKECPQHELCESAKFALKNLGKTDEQLIREFEKKNKR